MQRSQRLGMGLGAPLLLFVVSMGGYWAVSGTAIVEDPQPQAVEVPTGRTITPTAARSAIFEDLNPGHSAAPDLRASHGAAVSVSPDGQLLAIMTSGYNLHFGQDGKPIPELSTEYIFLFDVTSSRPKQL